MHETRWDAGWKRPAHVAGLSRGGRSGQRRLRWLFPLGLAAYMAALAVATHWPPQRFPRLPFRVDVSDKLAHFGAYALLGLLIVFTAHALGAQRRRLVHWIGLTCGILLLIAGLGLCDEWTQPIVGRQFDWLDWTADLAGAATAAILGSVYLPIQKRLLPDTKATSLVRGVQDMHDK